MIVRRRLFAIAFGAAAVLAIAVGAFWYFGPVDDCLDAGGRWIESEQICEGAR
jgi:hypothetical protein